MRPAELRRIRVERGMTQDDLAAVSGINARTIIRMEQGKPVRPDTVKAICAALDLPFTPWGTIEVVGPDRLRDHPSTDRLLAAAETLADVRYLVRPDAKEAGAHLRRLIRAGKVGLVWEMLNCFMLVWHCVLTAGMGFYGSVICMMEYGTWTTLDRAGTLTLGKMAGGGFVFLGIAGLLLYLVGEGVRMIAARARMFDFPERVDQGIAVGEDALWLMRIAEGDGIDLFRVDLAEPDARGLRRVAVFDRMDGQAVVRISLGQGGEPVYEVVPDEPGLVDLIERQRPRDQVQRLSIPRPAAA